ncbi:MAG: hypothetical protein GYA17_15050 [Chloroflexi bacterium]|jgi:hypothetical protein|nr:hypothetical protein [Anaerolineaceae bacterium]NMB89675.1 hypothetical protein [Chloroflexota bacterium]
MPTVIVHIQSEDPVLGEIESLPAPGDTILTVKNPRRKDGKDLAFIDPSVTTVIWTLSRVTFIEVLPAGEEDEIITFVRE